MASTSTGSTTWEKLTYPYLATSNAPLSVFSIKCPTKHNIHPNHVPPQTMVRRSNGLQSSKNATSHHPKLNTASKFLEYSFFTPVFSTPPCSILSALWQHHYLPLNGTSSSHESNISLTMQPLILTPSSPTKEVTCIYGCTPTHPISPNPKHGRELAVFTISATNRHFPSFRNNQHLCTTILCSSHAK